MVACKLIAEIIISSVPSNCTKYIGKSNRLCTWREIYELPLEKRHLAISLKDELFSLRRNITTKDRRNNRVIITIADARVIADVE